MMTNIDFSRAIPVGTDAKDRACEEARLCLKATDWYVIRQVETGATIPEDIATARQDARAVLSSA